MTSNTIDNDRTMSGNAGTLLANRYRIIRQLGQGGMGSVWLAEDTQLDDKQFAVKMLPSILVSNKRAYAQLKSEALVAMKLVHPNIVQIRAFEENDGNPFLVMDYIDGRTLDDYLAEKGKIGENETIRLLKPVAAALDYAHSQGVVHRDIKPANVMIRKDGVPFILDFGISREMQETMTRVTGKLSSGTLLYMSPEQLRGLPPKPAQDIYSFAAMAYECFKGEPPFSRGQIEFQILNEQPEPLLPDVSAAGSLSVGVNGQAARSTSIAASVMAGLAKKPEDRPATCAGVLAANDVGRAEHVESVDSGKSRLSRPQGSHALAKGVGTIALLVALASGAYYAWTRYEDVRKTAEERVAKLKAEKDAVEAEKRRIAAENQIITAEIREEHEKRIAELVAEIREEREKRIAELVAENRRILEEHGTQEKKPVEELARLDETNRKAESTSDGGGGPGNTPHDKSDAGENGSNQDAPTRARREYKPYTGPTKEYIVIAGDTIGGIAYSNGLSVRQLKDLNGLQGDVLRMGQKLKVPIKAVKPKDVAVTQSGHVAEKSISRQPAAETKDVLSQRDTRTLILPGGVEMEMVYVAPGSFRMGSDAGFPNAKPVHDIRITKGYWIGKYPVTQAQWNALVTANGVSFNNGGKPVPYFSSSGLGRDRVAGLDTSDFPMENISWEDCDTLVKALNKNEKGGRTWAMPTEAQWEFAARGGNKSRGYKYSGGDNMDVVGWYYENSGTKRLFDSEWKVGALETNKCRTHSVREKGVGNELGIVGMSGNVLEWCQDLYDENYYSKCPTDDPCNTASGGDRVLRGGGWVSFARYCRSASRGRYQPGFRSRSFGFRLCCSAGPRE